MKTTLLFLMLTAIATAQYQTATLLPGANTRELEWYKVNTGTPENPVYESRYRLNSPNLTNHAYVGKQDDVADYENTFRSVFGFNLSSIPQGAQIVNVTVSVAVTSTSSSATPVYEYDVYAYPQDPYQYSNAEAAWSASMATSKILDLPSSQNMQCGYCVLGTYQSNHAFSQYLQANFGNGCWISLKSALETWGGTYPPIHVMDMKRIAGQVSIFPSEAVMLEITYNESASVTFRNDFEFADPSGPDFIIDGADRAHGYSTQWQIGSNHSIEMYSHPNGIEYPADGNRLYMRDPWYWKRDIQGAVSTNLGATWNPVSTTNAANFTANQYRIVDNQFKTVYEESGGTISGISYYIDGQLWTNGSIKQSHNGSQFNYDAIFPFVYQSSGITYYLMNLREQNYGNYNSGTGDVTFTITPELHNKELYSNPNYAEYQRYVFYDIETSQEITSITPTIISLSNTDHTLVSSIPLSVNISGIDYYFIGWDYGDVGTVDYSSGTVTKTIVLGSDTYDYAAAMRGRYKAHLVSGADFSYTESRCGNCPNSQRKIDWTVAQTGMPYSTEGLYQTVYESNDKIWYTESIDHANTWIPEVLVDEGLRPTIASTSQKSYVAYLSGGGVTTKLYQNRSWTDITGVNNLDPTDDAAPVISIDSLDNVVLVVYEGLSDGLTYVVYLDDQEVDFGTIPNTGQYGSSHRPSLGHSQGAQSYHLVWREEGTILHQRIKIDANGSMWHGITFYGATVISNVNHHAKDAPSITIGKNGYPAVSWSSEDALHGKFISFRQNSSAGWGTMATMIADPNDSYFAPSVASLSDLQIGDDLRIAHNGYYGMAVQRLISGSWEVPTVYQSYEGLHPNTVDIVPSAYSHEVFAEYTNLFQGNAKLVSFGNSYLSRANRSSLESSREIVFIKDTTQAQIRFGELEVTSGQGDVDLGWNTGFDTLVVGKTKSIEDYLRTASIIVPQNAVLKYRSTRNKNGLQSMPSNLSLSFEVVNANTSQVIATLQQLSINGMNGNRVDGNYTLPLNSFTGQNVYVRGRITGLDSTVGLLAVDYYHNPGTTLPKNPNLYEESFVGEGGFTLSKNYPNPFNPTTTIRFSLQEAGEINLIVSDVYGRPVSVLADGIYGAGSFSTQFDATSLLSGTYYYSLHTSNGTLTRSMHLVK